MSTADHCKAMAEEADRLASVVSYARDKLRLQQQADSWRAKAAELETYAEPQAYESRSGVMSWLRRRVG